MNGLVAPVLFRGVAEYPLALLAGCAPDAAGTAARARPGARRESCLALSAGAVLAIAAWLIGNPRDETGALNSREPSCRSSPLPSRHAKA